MRRRPDGEARTKPKPARLKATLVFFDAVGLKTHDFPLTFSKKNGKVEDIIVAYESFSLTSNFYDNLSPLRTYAQSITPG